MRNKVVLYISYNSIKEPLVLGQVVSYISEIRKYGFEFILLTFEKEKFNLQEEYKIRNKLLENRIEWIYLDYHGKPKIIGTLIDISKGFMIGIKLVKENQVSMIHARSMISAIIAYAIKKKKIFPIYMISEDFG
ncbi:MAG: hypothetical protein D3923_08450 [Candidatus Electrothrix sp. AR3]|nr:hypothetical protein [Candidatus Electrothrix sp. AR3]